MPVSGTGHCQGQMAGVCSQETWTDLGSSLRAASGKSLLCARCPHQFLREDGSHSHPYRGDRTRAAVGAQSRANGPAPTAASPPVGKLPRFPPAVIFLSFPRLPTLLAALFLFKGSCLFSASRSPLMKATLARSLHCCPCSSGGDARGPQPSPSCTSLPRRCLSFPEHGACFLQLTLLPGVVTSSFE